MHLRPTAGKSIDPNAKSYAGRHVKDAVTVGRMPHRENGNANIGPAHHMIYRKGIVECRDAYLSEKVRGLPLEQV